MKRLHQGLAALDRAIATVGFEEFTELKEQIPTSDLTAKILGALRELASLQNPQALEPHYEQRWVTLFYVLWYQPQQTLLAYNALTDLARRREEACLHVVDLGCGALAGEIAVRLALSTGGFDLNGSSPEKVTVSSLDRSYPMLSLGKRIVDQLLKDRELSDVRFDLDRARQFLHTQADQLGHMYAEEDCWMTAFHTVYANTQTPINGLLRRTDEALQPSSTVLTAHWSKSMLLAASSPYGDRQHSLTRGAPAMCDAHPFPVCEETRILRNNIRELALKHRHPSMSDDDVGFLSGFLRNAPPWTDSSQKCAYLMHHRTKPASEPSQQGSLFDDLGGPESV